MVEKVFDAGAGLAPGWYDYGWCPRKIAPGAPASLDLSNYGGWIVARPGLDARFGGLSFRLLAPAGLGDFLEVRLDSGGADAFARVPVDAAVRRPAGPGAVDVFIPMARLNPKAAAFDRILFQAAKPIGTERVAIDRVGLTAFDSSARLAVEAAPGSQKPRAVTPGRKASLVIDCNARGHAISPLIYGVGSSDDGEALRDQLEMGATARRWGGNPASRYNWRLGNAWNTASDWYFTNVNYKKKADYSYNDFLDLQLGSGLATALTLPTLGWVAKDVGSFSFPLSRFGEQQQVAPENGQAGNGVDKRGKPLQPGPPTLTSVAAPPAFIGDWVRALRSKDSKRGRSVQLYILDNEPALWNSTHRDVHPEAVTYDELLDRTIRYGAAVRAADPDAVIAGPAEWGWTGYLYSARDKETGFFLRTDRRVHGDVPLVPWLLEKLREHDRHTGKRTLDSLDLHFYPQAPGVGIYLQGGTDTATKALRLRSTRGLWDRHYRDESWIGEPIYLLPRMREWIDREYPGLGLAIGEWNFGAENHQSGGLAVAEVLGRFGEHGVTAAFYWTAPPRASPAWWAFRAYRNFDGRGGHFLEHSVPARSSDQLASVFASRSKERDRIVAVVLNLDPERALEASIELSGCGAVVERTAHTYAGGPAGFSPLPTTTPRARLLHEPTAPYSITVFDMKVTSASR